MHLSGLANFLFLVESDFISDQSSSKMMNVFSEKGDQAFHIVGPDMANIVSFLVKAGDIVMLILLLVGMLFSIYSNVGNSGEMRAKGSNSIMGLYAGMLGLNILVILLFSSSVLKTGQLKTALIMLLFQFISFSGSILLFIYGTFYLEMYTIAGQPEYKRQSKTAYNYLFWLIAGSGAAGLVLELLL